MSIADNIFIQNCKDIIENGYDTCNEPTRAKWDDGTPAPTIKLFGVVNKYDLSKEFPIMTLRNINWKAALDEILWIWQKKSNNIKDLNSHIWDSWADEEGSIGKAYGYQLGTTFIHHTGDYKHFDNVIYKKFPSGYHTRNTQNGHDENNCINIYLDQVDAVLYDLKYNPSSRRIMTNIYNFQDLHEMNLYPCAYSMTFNVVGNKLNAILNQRSQDTLTANNWNVVQYALLLHMFAQVSGYEVGTLVHVVADMHIYDRHIKQVQELISREPLPAPVLKINPDVKNFYDFKVEDFELINYQNHGGVGKIPVAI